MNIEEIDKWLDNEYGCSYTRLEELHDYFFEKCTDQKEEIERLKELSKVDSQQAQEIINELKQEIERLNNKYSKALELLIDYNLPCDVDDFMNVHSDYCEINCGVDEEQYKRCWNKFIEWKLGSDKE